MPITETSQNIWEKEISQKPQDHIKYIRRTAFNHFTAAVEEAKRPSN